MNYYRINKNDFHEWLHQHIWTSNFDKEARKHYIPYLYDEITDWMYNLGYKMDDRWHNRGPIIVAKWLYAIHICEKALQVNHKPLNYPKIIHRNWEEDKDHYDFMIGIDDVDSFFETWDDIEDFEINSRICNRVKAEFRTFLYTYIDLDNSKQGRMIARKLEPDSESESEEQDVFQDLMSGAFGTTKKILGYNTM